MIGGRAKSIIKRLAGRLWESRVGRLVPEFAWVRAGLLSPYIRLMRRKGISGMPAAGSGARVLFLRMSFVPRMCTAELALAKQLAEDGAEPVFAYCSSVLPACSVLDFGCEDPADTCAYCERNNRVLAGLHPYRSRFLGDVVDQKDVREARRWSEGVAIGDLKNLSVYGVSLGNEMYLSLAKSLFLGSIPTTPENTRLARSFAASAALLVKGLSRLLDAENPTVVVMNGGHIMWFGVAYRLLRERGIRVVTFDETNIAVTRQTWNFDDGAPVVDNDWSDVWDSLRSVALSGSERAEIEALIERRREYFLYEPAHSMVSPSECWDLSGYRTRLVLFTNVAWDATVVGKDPYFDDMLDWVETTCREVAAQPDVCLVVRVHPAEAGVHGMVSRETVLDRLRVAFRTLPDNVKVVGPEERVDSYALIELSDAVLVYCSNIGLEAVLMGRPVIVCGQAHYGAKGFTVDITGRQDYLRILASAGETAPAAPDRELALRYAYLAFIDTQIDLELFTDEHPFLVTGLTVDSLSKPFPEPPGATMHALSRWVLEGRGGFRRREHLEGAR